MVQDIRICEDEFPLGSFPAQKLPGFSMNAILKAQLDILIKNIKRDWDFTIIISGGGGVRVGKSVLAMQIGKYWSSEMKRLYGNEVPFDTEYNFVFDGADLIKKGNYLGTHHPNSCIIFDEAGADLEGRKVVQKTTQNVLDYFRECGQYNMLNILVLPEYFDLPKSIATSRSIFLLDVFYSADNEGYFKRGYFRFYSKRNKKLLYLRGKRELNYGAYHANFQGNFTNVHTVDMEKYKNLKKEALKKRENDEEAVDKRVLQKNACYYLLNKEVGWTQPEIAEKLSKLTGLNITKDIVRYSIGAFTKHQKEVR